jgi:hypothetical protein
MANPASLTVNECSPNGSIAQPAVQTIDTNGTINCPVKSRTSRLMVELVNADDAAVDVTFIAGTSAAAHQARDLKVTLSATGGGTDKKIVGPLESSRFVKPDGSIDVAVLAAAGAPSLQIRVYRIPHQI